ncbi:ABC transporter substrate-binding protein [Microbacterium sp. X-17]|uniref:ABC transporter substrate-binding protein n=1 Tax=Microbacterium sp. X-17 TaxID=3144404 RepID=UPI0031F4ED48
MPKNASRRLRRVAAVAVALVLTTTAMAACSSSATPAASDGTPVHGGNLRVGLLGNGNQETNDPSQIITTMDFARTRQILDTLTVAGQDGIKMSLAESMTPNSDATVWTIKLPAGVLFSDGTPLTSADVIWTFKYHMNPATVSKSASALADVADLKAVDDLTVEADLKTPNSLFPSAVSDFRLGIFKAGTTNFDKPIGTGPFVLSEFDPGHQSVLTANPHYRVAGEPYLNSVTLVSINDDQARTNALLGGQVDAIAAVAPAQFQSLESNKAIQAISTPGSSFPAQYMFTSGSSAGALADPRVRQALRLLVDRQQILDNVYFGYGRLGNDLFGIDDPSYPSDLPQRQYDPEQAKKLLADAGQSDLHVDLYTSNIFPGIVDMSTLMVQQAQAGGVTITLHNLPSDQYWSQSYQVNPFGSTYWLGHPLVYFYNNMLVPGAGLPETLWTNTQWNDLYQQALRTPDPTAANALLTQAQKILYDQGGYIIPVFPNLLDAASTQVHGLKQNPYTALGEFDFTQVYLS